MRVTLSRDAAIDLDTIVDYTIDRWGAAQAEAYVDGLNRVLGGDRGLWRPVAGRPALRRLTYRSHFIFVEPRETDLLIVRILHRRSNVFLHLP